MEIDRVDFSELFVEKIWPWGPIRAVFKLGLEPPARLVSNVNFVPYIGDKWLVVRHRQGWCITGGTLEPGESYLECIQRELAEEAGARFKSFQLLGAWHCHSLADKPYRPHLPWPEFYRVVGYGAVQLFGQPSNPPGAEQVDEVALLPLEAACQRLETKAGDGLELAQTYRLAARSLALDLAAAKGSS